MNSDVAASALPASRAPVTARIAGAIDIVVEAVAAALLLSTVVIALIQVFCRYVLNNSLSWPEEMAKFAFVWFVFLGAAMVTRRSRHIVIDLVPRSLEPGRAAHPCGRGAGDLGVGRGVPADLRRRPGLEIDLHVARAAVALHLSLSRDPGRARRFRSSCWRSSRSTASAARSRRCSSTLAGVALYFVLGKRGRHAADRRVRRGLAAGHHGDRPDAARRADRRRADLRHLRGVPAAGRARAASRAAGHGQFARLPAARDPVLHAGGRHDECRRHHREADRARDHAGRPFPRRARARQRAHQHADGRRLGLIDGGRRGDRQDHGAGDGAARLSQAVRRRADQRGVDPRQHDSAEPRADHLRGARGGLGRRAVRRHHRARAC